MALKDSLHSFSRDPFSWMDNLNLTFRGNNLNLWQKYKRIQKTALYMSLICLALWILLGFDSTPLQFIHVLYEGIPGLILGQKGWGDMISIYNFNYGKEMHYSAFVIYLLVFYGLSKHWDSLGITKSKNLSYSFGVTFLAIGMFEWFWIISFGVFQSQPWVYTWAMPQLRILIQNTGFTFIGIIVWLYIWLDSFVLNEQNQIVRRLWRFRVNGMAALLIFTSVALALLWIFYPWPVQQISVALKDGTIWHSSRLFPQTLYTIKTDPASSINAGEWFWVEDNAVHTINTLVKAIWALTLFYIGCVIRVKHEID